MCLRPRASPPDSSHTDQIASVRLLSEVELVATKNQFEVSDHVK